jgi:pimeloyl-ACP methyl ester carboxylesterase
VRLHVEHHGSGEPLVLTHGGGSTGETWREQVAALATRHSVTVWDLPGHGRSERPDDPGQYTRDALLGHLGALVAAAGGGGPVALVGHSLGGYLSLALAIVRPELVRAIVAVATGPGFRDEESRRQWNEGIVTWGSGLGLPAHVAAVAAQPDALVIDRLAEISVPVLVVVGSRDRRFHAATEYFERKLGARVLVVDGAGHHVHETHAAEVNAAIVELLAGA